MSQQILIIGQGLAGSVLALQCERRGINVEIWNDESQYCSSQYAAGLWNPVSFKRITAPEHIQNLLHHCIDFFQWSNDYLNSHSFHHTPILRIFPDHQYANDWEIKSTLSKYENLLGSTAKILKHWRNDHQAGKVLSSGWLNVPLFLEATRKHFQSNNRYFQVSANALNEQLNKEETVHRFDHVIYCTGLAALPEVMDAIKIIPNKGHVLQVETSLPIDTEIVHYGNFAIPTGEQSLRVGSSYEWEKSDTTIDENIVATLTTNLEQTLQQSFSVKRVDVGLRPTVHDRQPIIGVWPQDKRWGIFNGLGTKGVLQSPLMAHLLLEHLTNGQPIPKPFSIDRFLQTKN
jgi:glycine/D-amino acid oxidase-like deaminating enzyme